MKKVKYIPDGYTAMTPVLAIRDAAKAIEFYKKAYGAKEIMRFADPAGKVMHAELKIGDGLIMIAEENPDFKNQSPQTLGGSSIILHLYVEDVDAFVHNAIAAGAKLVFPVQDQFYGDRSGRIADPYGHMWSISTHKEDVPLQEMYKRSEALFGQKK